MGSSRHPRILADLLRQRASSDRRIVALGGGAPAVGPSGELVDVDRLTSGQLDIYMESEVVGDWIAATFLPIYVPLSFKGSFTGWQLLTDSQYAELTVEVFRDTGENHPPEVSDRVSGSTPPSVIGLRGESSSTLRGWSAAFQAGDVLRFRPLKVWLCSQATLSLRWVRL